MDLSTLTDAQQLHQQFQQHQLQQQQQEQLAEQHQQQDLSSQYYDPSQAQAYDQASQAYYSYHHYQQQSHQQYAGYYPDYTNNAYQPQQSQQDSATIHPPGVSIASEASQVYAAAQGHGQGQFQGQAQAQAQHQQNAYYYQGVFEQQQPLQQQQQQPPPPQQPQQPDPSYPVPTGLNPAAAAAVAALSQLTQFAGSMDAAERAMAGLQERQWHSNGAYGPIPMPMPMQGPMSHGPFPMRPPVGRSPYRGSGRRGGGPFRGGGRGNFGHRQSRPDGPGPQFRGRGRMGRGGGRRHPHVAASTSHQSTASNQELAASAEDEGTTSAAGQGAPSDVAQGKASEVQGLPMSALVPGKVAPTPRPPQIAWCELCRVDCTSLEILEQHKNGKRHKKNLQRFEELQNARKVIPSIQTEQKPVSATQNEKKPEPSLPSEGKSVGEVQNEQKPEPALPSEGKPLAEVQIEQKPEPALPSEGKPLAEVQSEQNPAKVTENEALPVLESKSDVTTQPENLLGIDENKSNGENLDTEVPIAENKMDTEQPNNSEEQSEATKVEQAETPAKRSRMDWVDSRRRGMKRKMRGGRGGKRMRMSEQPRRPVEPPKPKEVVPLICDLCNVKCDTQAVFECHLAGKKHLSKLKRFQGHQAMYGPSGLEALYPPTPSARSSVFVPQGHLQSYNGPRGSLPHLAGYGVPQALQASTAAADSQAQLPAIAAGGPEVQIQRSEPHVMLEPGVKNMAVVGPDLQKETSAVEAEGQPAAASMASKSEIISISVSEGKEFSAATDNSVVPSTSVNTTSMVAHKMDDHGSRNEEPTA